MPDGRQTCQVIDKGTAEKIDDIDSEDSSAWMVIAIILVILICIILLIAVCVIGAIRYKKKPDLSDNSKTKIHAKANMQESNRDDHELI